MMTIIKVERKGMMIKKEMIANKKQEKIVQWLLEIGFKSKEIDAFFDYFNYHQENLIYELFKNHRQKILNQIHEKEHQISQLDYFLSQFKKNFQGG